VHIVGALCAPSDEMTEAWGALGEDRRSPATRRQQRWPAAPLLAHLRVPRRSFWIRRAH